MHGISQERDYNEIMRLLMNILKADIKLQNENEGKGPLANARSPKSGKRVGGTKFSHLINNDNEINNSTGERLKFGPNGEKNLECVGEPISIKKVKIQSKDIFESASGSPLLGRSKLIAKEASIFDETPNMIHGRSSLYNDAGLGVAEDQKKSDDRQN
jgi:hypothetical protein